MDDLNAPAVANYFRLPYRPHPRQLVFHTTRAPFRLFGGAASGGKSFALRWEAYAQCLAIPHWTALLLRRTSKELEDNHISKMRHEIPSELATYNEQDSVLTFFNGSTLRFGHIETKRDMMKYQGGEYGLIAPDELTITLTFDEFVFLTSRNRNVNGIPNFAAATNPGGPGHAYCKALWIDKKPFMGWPATGYNPDDFAYIPSRIYDNPAIMEKNPEYEKLLRGLPEALRAAYLDGSWDLVAGQYFDCFNVTQHVEMADVIESPPWVERNIGVDWGFAHDSAVEWGVTDERAQHLTIYRELVCPRLTPEQLAQGIVDLTPPNERRSIANIYLSHDAYEQRREVFTIADQMGSVLQKGGLPYPTMAANSRVPGWVHIYEMFRAGQLSIGKNCRRLIAILPELQRDPDCPDDVLKIDTDNPADALRYLVQSRWGTGNPPFEVQTGRVLEEMTKTGGAPRDPMHERMRRLIAEDRARREMPRPISIARNFRSARRGRAGLFGKTR